MATGPGILVVTQMFPPAVGGSGVLLENVYARVAADVDVTVLTDAATCGGTETRRGALNIARTHIDGHNWGLLSRRALADHLGLARTIASHARGRRIVHCGRAQPEGVAALLARTLFRSSRYVLWVHGEEVTSALTSRDFAFTMRRVHRHAAAIVANSQHTVRILADVGVPTEKVSVVYPGVDAQRFNPETDATALRRRLAPAGELLLLSVGRMQRRKGHDLAIAAMARLRDHTPRLRYVIAGDGEQRQALEALARELGIADRVVFEGEVSWSALPSYFAACDVFVLPNRIDAHDFEGFGIVFLEAAAAGKPVIGGRSGGVPEAVREGETGFLVTGTDVDELAAVLRQLAGSEGLRRQMGMAGRARVLRSFTWEQSAAALAALHARLTASGRVDAIAGDAETVGAST